MYESPGKPKNIIPSFSDREGDDHILSPVSKTQIDDPSLIRKQYILLSDAAKKTLSFVVAGDAMTGFEICLFHFITPVDSFKQNIPHYKCLRITRNFDLHQTIDMAMRI
jgi:hypothetical protein